VERQTYGQQKGNVGQRCFSRQALKKRIKEVKVLKDTQDTDVGGQAHNQQKFSVAFVRYLFQVNACYVVYNNSSRYYEDIAGNKGHVEITARNKQH
jgi:hypothetical protein